MNVVVVELDRVEVNPAQRTLIEGETFTVRATLRGPEGETLSGRNIVWTSSAPGVASLSSTAGSQVTVTGVAAGQAVVRATAEGISGSVQVGVLEGPSLVLGTTQLTIPGIQGESAPGVDVDVTNGGNGIISGLATQVTYGAGGPGGWLSVGLAGTTVPTSLTVLASAAGLTPGTYGATVRVTSPSAGGLVAELPVTFVVSPPPPAIALEANSVGMSASPGSPAPAITGVAVTNGGAGDLTGLEAEVIYPPGGRQGWLSAGLAGTQAPTTLTLSASALTLPTGTYTARVSVTSPVARVSPVFLDVTFTVRPGGVPGRGGPEGVP